MGRSRQNAASRTRTLLQGCLEGTEADKNGRQGAWEIVSLARYLREPLWAFRVADPGTATVLVWKTVRHHFANWLKLPRNDATAFSIRLDLGAAKPSTISLRAVGGDITILYEVFTERAYQIPDAALPPDTVRTVVDCGAHIGLSALYFAYRYPRARVIAVEPNPTNFRMLAANTAQEPRITPIQACISDRSGVSHIGLEGPGWGHRTGSVGVEVAALTLEDICKRFGIGTIDLLKMDVEGAERAVFANGVGDTRVVAAELHDDYTIDCFARDVAPRKVSTRKGRDSVFAVPD